MKDLHDKNKKHYTDFEREKQTKFGSKSKIVSKGVNSLSMGSVDRVREPFADGWPHLPKEQIE